MQTSIPATETAVAKTVREVVATQPSRLMSLDLFRGATIAAMILVNNAGDESSSYWPLRHAEWNGWTSTDLIFPSFLFIVGVATAFSFSSRLARGQSRGSLLKHVLWRGLAILAIGLFLNGFPNHYQLDSWRFYGVLQRIAVCYVITALLELWTGWRTQVAVAIACLAGYWILMRYVSVPGFGIPTHDIPLLDPDRNIVAWLDRKLLMGHLYEHTRDPEGLLSTIPVIATCLLGLLTGKWMRTKNSGEIKTVGMIIAGVVLVIVGRTTHLWFPINKKLWTSSFVLLTAGLGLICLAACYWMADVKQFRGRWTKPILIFGTNAIAAYFFAEVLAHTLYRVRLNGGMSLQEYIYSHFFAPLASPPNASLLYALVYVALCWTAMFFLYRKGITVKI
jgi:predicted acyltransferase